MLIVDQKARVSRLLHKSRKEIREILGTNSVDQSNAYMREVGSRIYLSCALIIDNHCGLNQKTWHYMVLGIMQDPARGAW